MTSFAKLVGMDKAEMQKLWDAVRANHALLDACPRHEFSIDTTPETIFSKTWQCARCSGTVDGMAKLWYERGIEHYSKDRP